MIAQASPQTPVRVLIVDDHEPLRRATRDVVEWTTGFEVVAELATGEASVEAARALRPDLILMDVNLPGINGLEATRQILAESNEVVVVILSGYGKDDYGAQTVEAGAAAFISKSEFSSDTLLEAWRSRTG